FTDAAVSGLEYGDWSSACIRQTPESWPRVARTGGRSRPTRLRFSGIGLNSNLRIAKYAAFGDRRRRRFCSRWPAGHLPRATRPGPRVVNTTTSLPTTARPLCPCPIGAWLPAWYAADSCASENSLASEGGSWVMRCGTLASEVQ